MVFKEKETTSTRSIMLGMRGKWGDMVPLTRRCITVRTGSMGKQREGVVGVVKHVDV